LKNAKEKALDRGLSTPLTGTGEEEHHLQKKEKRTLAQGVHEVRQRKAQRGCPGKRGMPGSRRKRPEKGA